MAWTTTLTWDTLAHLPLRKYSLEPFWHPTTPSRSVSWIWAINQQFCYHNYNKQKGLTPTCQSFFIINIFTKCSTILVLMPSKMVLVSKALQFEHKSQAKQPILSNQTLFVQVDEHVLCVGKLQNYHDIVAVVIFIASNFKLRWLNITAGTILLALQF